MDKVKKVFKCAIYTRKSHEEGLEQEFNSLDAQREASVSYINSQKHEGWMLVDKAYNDGGYSGGNLERPALKRLMTDIDAGKVDIIVVYKVDRLSRSIHDFAGLMKTFDERKVSFVSVTQQFNTTTSMGRLTLNILLSFAQFEREVTGERIRDKIAASKKKGYWMGGVLPLGYRVEDRRLIVIPEEKQLLKLVFTIYLGTHSLLETSNTLNKQGFRTKYWITQSGNEQGGKAFTPKYVYRLLTNPLYIGKIRHKKKCFNGLHEALIDKRTWDRAQALLQSTPTLFGVSKNKQSLTYLLKGKIKTVEGFTMSPSSSSMTNKALTKTKIGYYVSQKAIKNGYASCPIKTINSSTLDQFVGQQVNDYLGHEIPTQKTKNLRPLIDVVIIGEAFIRILLNKRQLTRLSESAIQALPNMHKVQKSRSVFKPKISESSNQVILDSRVRLKAINGRTCIVDKHGQSVIITERHKPDEAIVKAIGRAYKWLEYLRKTQISIAELAKTTGFNKRYIENIIRLTRLSPALLEQALKGTLPSTLKQLLECCQFYDWAQQATHLKAL